MRRKIWLCQLEALSGCALCAFLPVSGIATASQYTGAALDIGLGLLRLLPAMLGHRSRLLSRRVQARQRICGAEYCWRLSMMAGM